MIDILVVVIVRIVCGVEVIVLAFFALVGDVGDVVDVVATVDFAIVVVDVVVVVAVVLFAVVVVLRYRYFFVFCLDLVRGPVNVRPSVLVVIGANQANSDVNRWTPEVNTSMSGASQRIL